MLLKAILNRIETQEATKYEMGTYFSSMESSTEANKIEQLSSLVAWLVRQLKFLKPLCDGDVKAKSGLCFRNKQIEPNSIGVASKMSRDIIMCRQEFMESALHLAQLIGK